MDLNLHRLAEKIEENEFIKNFLKELGEALEKLSNKQGNIKLSNEEELEYDRKEFKFLHDYFKEELSDLSMGEIFIVTDKYENDDEYHRYKVTQYKNNFECKYVAFEKDLPENVKIGDVVRKIDEKYYYDEKATQYVKDSLNKIKQEIVDNRII